MSFQSNELRLCLHELVVFSSHWYRVIVRNEVFSSYRLLLMEWTVARLSAAISPYLPHLHFLSQDHTSPPMRSQWGGLRSAHRVLGLNEFTTDSYNNLYIMEHDGVWRLGVVYKTTTGNQVRAGMCRKEHIWQTHLDSAINRISHA